MSRVNLAMRGERGWELEKGREVRSKPSKHLDKDVPFNIVSFLTLGL